MTKEELITLVKNLDEDSLKEQGIFGIYQYGGGPDESSIKANKEGLQLFALELLRASDNFKNKTHGNHEKIFNLNYDENWIDKNSHIFINFIEHSSKEETTINEEQIENFIDKLIPYGCGAIFILIGFSILLGLIQILDFIISLFKT